MKGAPHDTVGIKSADLKQKFLFLSFPAFRTNCLDVGKDRRPQTVMCCLEGIREIKVSRDKFGRVLVISFFHGSIR